MSRALQGDWIMADAGKDTITYQPRPRPEWVRGANDMGRSIDARATVGEVGNADAELIKIGKAGRNRWKGKRPQTRGVAMNPVDHPLGGGEGKSSGGRHPVSPWGQPEGRTRSKKKESQKLIIRRRRTRGSRR